MLSCGTPTIKLSSPGPFPLTSTATSVVDITAAVTIAGTNVQAKCVHVLSGGSLTLSGGGHLSTETLIIDAGATLKASGSWEISFKDAVPTDVDQLSVGLVAHGDCDLQGTPLAHTFVRLAAEVAVGQTTLTTALATGWKVGDRLWVPWTKQLIYAERYANFIDRSEFVTIKAIVGTTITLTTPTKFEHKGARWRFGATPVYLPHVVNLSRSATIRSESVTHRGHCMFMGRLTSKYVSYRDLGRTTPYSISATNIKGRYALHMHLCGDTAPQVIGNAIERTSKWAITLHGTHHGLVKDNVIVRVGGAGIVCEDGNESFNVIDHNFVGDCYGNGSRQQFGREGIAYWFRGPNNYIRNNVAANWRSRDSAEASYGYEIYLENLANITYPGASNVNPHALPILQFENNEGYAGTSGISMWWIGIKDIVPQDAPVSVFKNTVLWHIAEYGEFAYPQHNCLYDGMVMIGDRTSLGAASYPPVVGFWPGDYVQDSVELRNWRIENMKVGIKPPLRMIGGTFTITNPTFYTEDRDIEIGTPWSVAANAKIVGKRNIFITTPTFTPPDESHANIYRVSKSTVGVGYNLMVLDRVFWDGDPVFAVNQRPDYVPLTSVTNAQGVTTLVGQDPPGGKTNQQLADAGKPPYGGELATCTTTVVGLTGYCCPSGTTPPTPLPPPPAPPSNVTVV